MTITFDLPNNVRLVSITFLAVWLTMVAMADDISASTPPSSPSAIPAASTMKPLLALVRKVGLLREQANPSASEAKQLAIDLGEAASQIGEDAKDAVFVYQAEAMAMAGQRKEANKLLARVTSAADKPEVLLVRLQLIASEDVREEGRQRQAISDELGKLFPISVWGTDRDVRLSGGVSKTNPPVIEVPKLAALPSLVDVAKRFELIGKHEDAIDAYLVAIYGRAVGRTGVDVGQLWLNIAAFERNRGHIPLAIRAYLHASAASKDTMEAAMNDISKRDATSKPTESASASVPDVKGALQYIMSSYCKMNMHPLAIRLAAEAQKDGIDMGADGKSIVEEWEAIVKNHESHQQKYVLGLKRSDIRDWSKAQINRPTTAFWFAIGKGHSYGDIKETTTNPANGNEATETSN